MSRCFPYPPPGYEKRDEPLIESIKFQNERNRAKKEKKKERRREKKENQEKLRDLTALSQDKKHENKKRHHEESVLFKNKIGPRSKRREDGTDLERSSLTEEQSLPCLRYSCDSPDSSQNSSKRKKLDETDVGTITHGSVLRIRLPSLKQRDAEPLSLVEQASTALLKRDEMAQPTLAELPCFSGRTEIACKQEETSNSCDLSLLKSYSGSSKSRRKEQKFRDLIVNWKPEPIDVDKSDVDDQEWLFGGIERCHDISRKSCHEDSMHTDLGCSLSSWPPRACILGNSEVHALPYVLPF